jgi:hypothetical protein
LARQVFSKLKKREIYAHLLIVWQEVKADGNDMEDDHKPKPKSKKISKQIKYKK